MTGHYRMHPNEREAAPLRIPPLANQSRVSGEAPRGRFGSITNQRISNVRLCQPKRHVSPTVSRFPVPKPDDEKSISALLRFATESVARETV